MVLVLAELLTADRKCARTFYAVNMPQCVAYVSTILTHSALLYYRLPPARKSEQLFVRFFRWLHEKQELWIIIKSLTQQCAQFFHFLFLSVTKFFLFIFAVSLLPFRLLFFCEKYLVLTQSGYFYENIVEILLYIITKWLTTLLKIFQLNKYRGLHPKICYIASALHCKHFP